MQRRRFPRQTSSQRRARSPSIAPLHPNLLRNVGPLSVKRPRSYGVRQRIRHASPLVVCSTDYTEKDLMRLTLVGLQQIVIDYDLGVYKGMTKRALSKEILKSRPDVDIYNYKGYTGAVQQRSDITLDSLEYNSRSELIDLLSRFTSEELQEELRTRKASTAGLKMNIVERLAALLEEEKLKGNLSSDTSPLGPLTSGKTPSQNADKMSDVEMRALLDSRMGSGFINFSKYVDVRYFVECLMLGDSLWKAPKIDETKGKMVQRIARGIEVLQPENETLQSLITRCEELKVERMENDTHDILLEKLKKDEAERLNDINKEEGDLEYRLFEQLKFWFEDIQAQLASAPDFQTIAHASDEVVVREARESGFDEASVEDCREFLRGKKMVETQFYMRSMALLSTQMIHRVLTMTAQEISYMFNLLSRQISLLHESSGYRSLMHVLFLQLAIPVFESLYESVMAVDGETREVIEQYNSEIDLSYAEAGDETAPDPPLSIGVVFGVTHAKMIETFSSVHCLVDHLQSAPYQTDPFNRKRSDTNMCVVLYCVRTDKKPAIVQKMMLDEFLSLDVSYFTQPHSESRHVGQTYAEFSDFLNELSLLHHCISLTPSLDVVAAEDAAVATRLKELDDLFIGSSSSARLMTNNRFGCLVYLRKKGFMIPPIYRLRKQHLVDLEKWSRGFERWCEYHKMSRVQQLFQLRPSNIHEREARVESTGIAEIVSASRRLFEEKGMEEVIIQPKMPKNSYIDFSCVVLETKQGPLALAPTEFEELPPELVRAFSSPLRRHTPPKRTAEMVQAMRNVAARVFKELDLSGYACIHGRAMIDYQKEEDLKNEKLEYPRPIPDIPSPEDELELPPELIEHMEHLYEEREKELDELVESYDTSRYTLDALRYFEFLDEEDAKKGIIRNRYRELEACIEHLRHRNDPKKSDHSTMMQSLRWQETLDAMIREMESQEPSIASLCKGEDFSISVTGVDSILPFAMDSLIFQQAAVSGLSHRCVLIHLLNLKLPKTWQIPATAETPEKWNPFYPETYVEGELAAHDQRPAQVWILCGGDNVGHQASLASGLNALLKLRSMNDVQPYLFILDCGRRMGATPEVLKALIERRDGLMEQGVPEEELMEECTKKYLASPRAVERDMPWKPVWCVHDAHTLVPTIDEAIEASDRYRELTVSATVSHTTLTSDYEDMLLAFQAELKESGVEGVCSLFGGKVDELPPAARMMTLDVFATEAASVGATVFSTVHGDIAQDGMLQDFLRSYGIVCTGCGVTASNLCANKQEMTAYINQLKLASVLPKKPVTMIQLKECAKDLETAEEFLRESAQFLNSGTEFCIKPARDAFGCGVARIASAKDLQVYSRALEEKWEIIPGDLLTSGHCTVPMPKPSSETYFLEPYISPAHPSEVADLAQLPVDKAFMEVSFGLVGEFGQMWVLTPSLVFTNLMSDDAMEDRLVRGKKHVMTPIPASLIDANFVETAKKTVAVLADSMGLAGVARVDAFLSPVDGELIVIEVDTTPFLGEHSLILQQAALESPPMLPDEVFRQILEAAHKDVPRSLTEVSEALPKEPPQGETSDETEEDEEDPSDVDVDIWDDSKLWESDDLAKNASFEASDEKQETLRNLWGSDDEAGITDSDESLQNTS